MQFKLKSFKFFKIKQYFKTTKLFLFYHGINIKSSNWIKIEQKLKKLHLQYYKIYNTLIRKSIKSSIFKNIISLVHGPGVFVNTKNFTKFTLKNLVSINKSLSMLCVRINNKIYSVSQLKTINTISFRKNLSILRKLLKKSLKTPYNDFKK